VRKRFLLSLSIPLGLASLPAGAGGASDELQSIVVTATRIPTPQSQIASSITVITAEDIAARQQQSLPDALKEVPGLNLVQSGGPGGQTSIFMRGTDSNHTKVLVDGIDLSDPSNPTGAFDFAHLLLQDVQRVEVLRGPQSGLYGSDAIGGIINIITKSGAGPAQLIATLQGGSFATFNQAASIGGAADRLHYMFTVDHIHSGATPVTPLGLLQPGEQRIDDYYDNLSASTKLGYDVTEHFDLGLVARYTDTHLRFTSNDYNFFPAPPADVQSENDTKQFDTRLTAHGLAFDGLLDSTLGVAYGRSEADDFTPGGFPPESAYTGSRVKVDYQGNILLASTQTLVVGAEHQRDEIQDPISANTTINSGYLELQSALRANFFNTLSVRYDDNDRFGSKVTYRIAPVYTVRDSGTMLKATLGTGFKAPTLSQMFQDFPDFGFFGNPDLKPERSVGWDAGFEQPFANDQFRFGATYFRNDIKDLIGDNLQFTSYINIGHVMTQGVESFLTFRPVKELTLRADYTYTEATDQTTHEELLRRPKNKATLRASWQATPRLLIDSTVLYVGNWVDGNRDFSVQRLDAPGYTTWDVAGTYVLTKNFSVFARVNNLLDKTYETPVGFLAPSIGAFAGVKVTF
jgi:vitamin B12 transporter